MNDKRRFNLCHSIFENNFYHFVCYFLNPKLEFDVTVECTAGVREWGCTGLTAVTIGIMLLLSIFVQPIITKVPNTTTAQIFIFFGP